MTKGTIIIAKGITSSDMPNVAPPRENIKNNSGSASLSSPLVFLIKAWIPASIAPVFIIIPKEPPTTKINATIPTAEPYLSPVTRPSKT